ncbi:YdbL family protein [Rhizobium laguerreae]|nr:YdbL family protein [Rhizobium laguerreae]
MSKSPVRYYDSTKERVVQTVPQEFDLAGPTQWLKGEQDRLAEIASQSAPPAGGKRHYITPALAAALTEGFLGKVSTEAYKYFVSGMPQQYELLRHHDLRLVEKLPHLGYCSFAAIRKQKPDGSPYVVRLHFANFNARIDTTPGATFFDAGSINRGAMFFGVAFCPDANNPQSVMIDRSIHHSGISFITTDPRKALDAAIALRTGVSADEWRKMAVQKLAEQSRAVAKRAA